MPFTPSLRLAWQITKREVIVISVKLKFNDFIIPILAALFNVILMLFPQSVLCGAKEGLILWFNRVVPSLFPFLIGSYFLNATGLCDFLGVLFSPFMNKVFKISGEGAYALAIGFTSGCPLGAKTVCELRKSNKLNKNEAQRLLGFSNNSGPLFVLGTVGCSMLMNKTLGILILICHYSSAVLTGIILSFTRDRKEKTSNGKASFKLALKALHGRKSSAAFGALLCDAVKSSVESITMIGGFIVLFSVIAKIITILLRAMSVSPILSSFCVGVIEVTNGISALSDIKTAFSVCIISAVLSWGGFSIHAQSIAYILKTDLSPTLYMLSRLMQALISFLLSLILMPVFKMLADTEDAFLRNLSPISTLKASVSGFFIVHILLFALPAFIMLVLFVFRKLSKAYR